MPTEHKPAAQFQREDRYIVIKRSDLAKRSPKYQEMLSRALGALSLPRRSSVVIESDWPEYNFVWLMLEHRMAGFPVPDFNAVKCAADVAAVQSQLTALREELDLLRMQAINDAEANTAIRAERDALRQLLNAADQRNDELESQLTCAVDALNEVVKVSAMYEKPFEIATLAIGELSASAEPA